MALRVQAKLIGVLVDLFPFLEPFFPPFISLYLSRQLRRWRDMGLISGYNRSVKRLGKMHYVVSVDLELTQGEVDRLLGQAERRA